MKCKDCSCLRSEVYVRYHDERGYYKSARWMCCGVKEPFEITDMNDECPAYPERRDLAQDECPYCNKNKYNGGFNIQVAHVQFNKINYTALEAKFCPACGNSLEVF